MIGGLITGLSPNLIQDVFFNSKCLWQTTRDKLISIHGSGKGSGTRNLGQAKALEPSAWVKQRPWSHEPGSSKGAGTICLGQARVEGTNSMGHTQVEGPKGWDRAQDSRD